MKVVFISSLTPSGHYSQYVARAIAYRKKIKLVVYTSKDEQSPQLPGVVIKKVWHKSLRYLYQILKQVAVDRPDIVHIQQEFNMYGGVITTAVFPILIALLKARGVRVVVTIHAAVYKNQITDQFVFFFKGKTKLIKPFMVKWFFQYLYYTTGYFSDIITIHTKRKKHILTHDFKLPEDKIHIIPVVIPAKKIATGKRDRYFLYFGYMVRRKGLSYVIRGFKKFRQQNPKKKFKLLLAGGIIKGQEESFEEIKKLIKQLRAEKDIQIVGFIDEKRQDELYQKAYAVVIPSIVSMGSSGPLYHARSYGKCVIATREGYFLEDIVQNKSGLLTHNDWWAETFYFATKHPDVIKDIQQESAKIAREQSPRRVGLLYERLYVNVLKNQI